jgi:hypothetical protein
VREPGKKVLFFRLPVLLASLGVLSSRILSQQARAGNHGAFRPGLSSSSGTGVRIAALSRRGPAGDFCRSSDRCGPAGPTPVK